ncbi:MAG: hypothetical protein A2W91_17560 [Bacteroidetes bacterium GWF2_38_335]|nr:MAG: hypothetical protein A2W91_17560 [Bacteroidetes bacterium GWF2_38_335]OFY78059.1 MAG: hypothetical protein A2281_18900 [Bacteroidetes bacterium RIFOXYA12_FULL_38_20]HBS88331.1 tRNA (adenosine(37)-N6)-methyltransferase TrmM [Bacteroidales bacterium]
MANDYFQFKQFRVNQSIAAMKVGTDGVLIGAWANCSGAKKILDIGTGTGLIALMMAQRSKAMIDAIDIDLNAFFEAKKNIEKSPWPDRIYIYNESFQQFSDNPYHTGYDLIVSNPPYFSDSLKSEDISRTAARHNSLLPFEDLINGVKSALSKNGIFSIILPVNGAKEFIEMAEESQLFCFRKTFVKPTPDIEPHRLMMEFSKTKSDCIEDFLIIESGDRHQYSIEYTELTKDFYLNF